MNRVISLNVATDYNLQNHNVNANEDGSPKNVNDRTSISGQKIRYMFFETMKDFLGENSNTQTEIETGDSVTGDIANQIRSDLGGFLLPVSGSLSPKRKSPMNVMYAVSRSTSTYFDDLFVRFATNTGNSKDKEQRINNKTYSANDDIELNYQFNLDEIGTIKDFEFDKNSQFVSEKYNQVISDDEKIRRIKLSLNATSYLVGLANTARNAVENVPNKAFICFSDVRTSKKVFDLSKDERLAYIEHLRNSGYTVFYGEGDAEVSLAYKQANEFIDSNKELFLLK